MTEATRSPQRTVPYQAALLYNAGPNLRNVVSDFMTERHRRVIGERGIRLASRPMTFESAHDFQQFKAQSIDPYLRGSTPLSRLDLQTDVDVLDVAKGSVELTRITFTPAYANVVALRGLYDASLKLRDDVVRGSIRDEMAKGRVSLTVNTRDLVASGDDLRFGMAERLLKARRSIGALYADDPRVSGQT